MLTNKVRLWERSEPQSEPFVGQARRGHIENIFLGGCADLRGGVGWRLLLEIHSGSITLNLNKSAFCKQSEPNFCVHIHCRSSSEIFNNAAMSIKYYITKNLLWSRGMNRLLHSCRWYHCADDAHFCTTTFAGDFCSWFQLFEHHAGIKSKNEL